MGENQKIIYRAKQMKKDCPKCGKVLPGNRKRCKCGHRFIKPRNGIASAMRKRYPRTPRLTHRNTKRRRNPRNSWRKDWDAS